ERRTTGTRTEAPLSLAKSEGGGSKASGSAAAGMMVSTRARSPVTACARLARSLVVATMRMLPAAAGCTMSDKPSRHTRTSMMRGLHRPRVPFAIARVLRSPFRNEDALREQAVHVLLGIRDRADTAIHRDAGEPVSIKPRDLL